MDLFAANIQEERIKLALFTDHWWGSAESGYSEYAVASPLAAYKRSKASSEQIEAATNTALEPLGLSLAELEERSPGFLAAQIKRIQE